MRLHFLFICLHVFVLRCHNVERVSHPIPLPQPPWPPLEQGPNDERCRLGPGNYLLLTFTVLTKTNWHARTLTTRNNHHHQHTSRCCHEPPLLVGYIRGAWWRGNDNNTTTTRPTPTPSTPHPASRALAHGDNQRRRATTTTNDDDNQRRRWPTMITMMTNDDDDQWRRWATTSNCSSLCFFLYKFHFIMHRTHFM